MQKHLQLLYPSRSSFQGSTHGNISDAGAGNGTTTGTLLVGEKVEYQATFTLDQSTIDSGQIRNCFSAQAIVKSTGANVNDSLDTCVDTQFLMFQ